MFEKDIEVLKRFSKAKFQLYVIREDYSPAHINEVIKILIPQWRVFYRIFLSHYEELESQHPDLPNHFFFLATHLAAMAKIRDPNATVDLDFMYAYKATELDIQELRVFYRNLYGKKDNDRAVIYEINQRILWLSFARLSSSRPEGDQCKYHLASVAFHLAGISAKSQESSLNARTDYGVMCKLGFVKTDLHEAEIWLSSVGPHHPIAANELADFFEQQNKFKEAAEQYQYAIDLASEKFPEISEKFDASYVSLAKLSFYGLGIAESEDYAIELLNAVKSYSTIARGFLALITNVPFEDTRKEIDELKKFIATKPAGANADLHKKLLLSFNNNVREKASSSKESTKKLTAPALLANYAEIRPLFAFTPQIQQYGIIREHTGYSHRELFFGK
jgi:hypothetical protein